jgi:hypothetical protein
MNVYNDDPDQQGGGDVMAVNIVNSTFSGNSVAANAGAILAYGNVSLRLFNTTVSNNSAAAGRTGGIQMSTGITEPSSAGNATPPSLTLASSIVADNTVRDVATNTTAIPTLAVIAANSLIETICPTCQIVVGGPGNIFATDPMLGPLGFNSGPTRTQALLPGSPAIDAGINPLGLTTDQRGTGFPRVNGAAADMGAYESP